MAKKTTEKEHLGKMVRCARTSRGFRQKELGELVGLSRSQVSALEGGTDQAPVWTIDLVSRVCEALDVYPEAFTHVSHHMARVLRGRVSTHMSHLGLWDRLGEAFSYLLVDIHRMRPDVVGMSVLVGSHPSGEVRTYVAHIGVKTFGESGLRPDEARHMRWTKMLEESRLSSQQDRLGPVQVLTYEEAPIVPDTQVLEWIFPGGGIQMALTGSAEGRDGPLSELMHHLADEISKQLERIRSQSGGSSSNVALELSRLTERVQRLENESK